MRRKSEAESSDLKLDLLPGNAVIVCELTRQASDLHLDADADIAPQRSRRGRSNAVERLLKPGRAKAE